MRKLKLEILDKLPEPQLIHDWDHSLATGPKSMFLPAKKKRWHNKKRNRYKMDKKKSVVFPAFSDSCSLQPSRPASIFLSASYQKLHFSCLRIPTIGLMSSLTVWGWNLTWPTSPIPLEPADSEDWAHVCWHFIRRARAHILPQQHSFLLFAQLYLCS